MAIGEFLGKVENGPQKVGERLVFEEYGVFEEPHEKIAVLHKKAFQYRKLDMLDLCPVIMVSGSFIAF